METVRSCREQLIDGLSRITGISKKKIRDYGERGDLLHIIDHPMSVGVTDQQYEKIGKLREFLNAYESLRRNEWQDRVVLSSISHAKEYFLSQLAYYRERELFLCAYLDSGMGVISCEKMAEGTVNLAAVFPRELVKRALQLDAVQVIAAHNHPGNSVEPSSEDVDLTRKLQTALETVGIKLTDHIIVGADRTASMRETGQITMHGLGADQGVAASPCEEEGADYER